MTAKTTKIHQRLHAPRAAFVLALLVFGWQSVEAAEHTGENVFLDKSFFVSFGGFFPSVDSGLTFDPDTVNIGTPLDGENILGLDEDVTTLLLYGRWRFHQRHRIEAEWIRLNRDGVRSATQTLTIGNTTAAIGAQLQSKFDVDIGRVTYGWSFIKDEKKEATVLAGVHIIHSEISVNLSGTLTDANTGAPIAAGAAAEGEGVTFPLPHIGARFGYAVTPKLFLDIGATLFYLEIDDLKGSLLDVGANAQYLLWRNVVAGAGVRYFDFNVEDDNSIGSDEFDFNYIGPVVFLGAAF